MASLRRLGVISLLAAGCSAPAIVREPRVAIRPRTGEQDCALVVIHPATLCGLTIRDESGRFVDRDPSFGEDRALDMTRRVPDAAWEVAAGNGVPHVFTAVAMPPGRYVLVGWLSSERWEPLGRSSHDGALLARTACDGALESHPLRLGFEVEPGNVTLLALPDGAVDFDDLRRLGDAADDPYVVLAAGSWFEGVRRARDRTRAELVRRQRQPRDGYDVYPACDGATAVVRGTGTPLPWDASLQDREARRRFGRPHFAPSVHATGYGRGCVRRFAYVLLLSDARELDAAARAAGEWLVRGDFAGEIDLVVRPIPAPDITKNERP